MVKKLDIKRKRQTRTKTFKASPYRSRRGADASDDRQRVPMDSKVNNGILNGLIQRSKHTRFTTI